MVPRDLFENKTKSIGKFERLCPDGWSLETTDSQYNQIFTNGKTGVFIDWSGSVYWLEKNTEGDWIKIHKETVPNPGAYALGVIIWSEY